MLESLINRLKVPPVPPAKYTGEPLEVSPVKAVPPIPQVPPKKIKIILEGVIDRISHQRSESLENIKRECLNDYSQEQWPELIKHFLSTADQNDDRRMCRECRHLSLDRRCTKQRFRPFDDIPRRCPDFSEYFL